MVKIICSECGKWFDDIMFDKLKNKRITAKRKYCNDCIDKLWRYIQK